MFHVTLCYSLQLIWALMTEERPPPEAFNPEVKRWASIALASRVRQHSQHCAKGSSIQPTSSCHPPCLPYLQFMHTQHPTFLTFLCCASSYGVFIPCTRSSGWQPPRDYGLWEVASALKERVLGALSPASRGYWEEEESYFDRVTSISGGSTESHLGHAHHTSYTASTVRSNSFACACRHQTRRAFAPLCTPSPLQATWRRLNNRSGHLHLRSACMFRNRFYVSAHTSCSGILKKIDREERRGAIAAELSKFSPPRPDLYIPTNPECRVLSHIPTSGTPMQSAAKVCILIPNTKTLSQLSVDVLSCRLHTVVCCGWELQTGRCSLAAPITPWPLLNLAPFPCNACEAGAVTSAYDCYIFLGFRLIFIG